MASKSRRGKQVSAFETDQVVLDEVLEAEQGVMPVFGNFRVPLLEQQLRAAGLDDRLEHDVHRDDRVHGGRQRTVRSGK